MCSQFCFDITLQPHGDIIDRAVQLGNKLREFGSSIDEMTEAPS
jgi:hypothetical protein